MVGGEAVNYANMMGMPVLNVAPSADFTSAVNLSQLNNYNSFNSNVNLNRNRINNLIAGRASMNAVNVRQIQCLIGGKYGTLTYNRNNIAILDKCANID